MRANEYVRGTPELVGAEIVPPRLDELEGETLFDIPDLERVGDPLPMGKKAIEDVAFLGVESRFEVPRDEGGIPEDPLVVINVEGSPSFPSFTESTIKDSQAMEVCPLQKN